MTAIDPHRPALQRGLRAALAGSALLVVSACAFAPDWARPSTAVDAITGSSPSEASNASVAAQQEDAERRSDAGTYPSVGSTPPVPDTADAQARRQVAESLVADRDRARYSGEALRGGTEPLVSPLPPRPAAPLPQIPDAGPEADAAPSQPAPVSGADAGVIPPAPIPEFQPPSRRLGDPRDASAPPPEPATEAAREIESEPLPAAQSQRARAPEPVPPAPAPPVSAPAATPAPAAAAPPPMAAASRPPAPARPVAAAPAAPASPPPTPARPVATAPAAPAASPTPPPAPPPAPARAAEAASRTPAVPRQAVPSFARGAESASASVAPRRQGLPPAAPAPRQAGASDAVIVNYAALGGAGRAALPGEPVAIYFAHGSARLSAEDRTALAQVAARQEMRGGGRVRVVGYASQRTADRSGEGHLLANFDISSQRANAVAAELIRLGVAPGDLVIEALSDRAAAASEAVSRRAEVFLE